MNEITKTEPIVFLELSKIDAEPFTTSDIIATYAKINYRSVQRLIEKHEKHLAKFGRVRFEITPFQTKGGKQDKKIFYLNEEQATLLITFLKNTEQVIEFKVELVRQFYFMRQELNKRYAERAKLHPIRQSMTDAIKANPDHSTWDYKHYTDLAYKIVLGKNAAQLRKERKAPATATAMDYMTAEEIAAVTDLQYRIGVLVETGMDYQQIKSALERRRMLQEAC